MAASQVLLPIPRFAQPDDTSCGPTCLAKVLEFHGDGGLLEDLVRSVPRLRGGGGTLGALLGLEAMRRGYGARLLVFGTRLVDPTWFGRAPGSLARRLRERADGRRDPRLRTALRALADFAAAGGRVEWEELTPRVLTAVLDRGRPLLVGVSATYLHRTPRERSRDNVPDAVHGDAVGHFVVVHGHRHGGAEFAVRDPLRPGPRGITWLRAERLLNSILVGDETYDDLLLEVWPLRSGRRR